ncbi:hypothetical protein QBC34DRAFT_330474 [Podospora aff. communis PSN243]|uniref:Ricin B lectin domain-containing protein n=1 Tax=Podospora aff. communis PSN243 TaxID=3040156 RepID=A0AAV9GIA5_9PEZI|nr:hypothetical protein QBC34DRAFT_330474 [Podospora aff. communis PSN243]
MHTSFSSLLGWAAVASAGSLVHRAVASLDEAATAEAHQRDNGATRAFSNVQIKTADGQCLFVDKLSGDFRANLTPVQVAACGSTDGQGWDIITEGTHISGDNVMLVVSTLTQACLNFDGRRAAGNQVLLFSCGGRADGGGAVTDSQIFEFDGSAGPLTLKPRNQAGSCLTVKGNALDIAACASGNAAQSFTLGGAVEGGNAGAAPAPAGSSTSCAQRIRTTTKSGRRTRSANRFRPKTTKATRTSAAAQPTSTAPAANTESEVESSADVSSAAPSSAASSVASSAPAAASSNPASAAISSAAPVSSSAAPSSSSSSSAAPTAAPNPGAIPTTNPTTPVPVSRAGGTLNPSAAAKAHQRDPTAVRTFSNVEIRAPNGQCISVDPTAGDFRQNLIPVALVDCSGAPNEKWDVIERGRHNKRGRIPAGIVVSALTQGCLNFDGRRQAGDTVTLFSCGGRADGTGETSTGQQFPFIGQLSFAFAPLSEGNRTCILDGPDGRLTSGACPTDGAQLFSIFP